jgi:nucleoside diphosphate kinase
MSGKVTFTMIKPDATAAGNTGKIIDKILEAGFTIKAMKWTRLSKEEAGKFYEVHKERPFFGELVDYMTSGPIVAAILEKDNAVEDFRNLIGATDLPNVWVIGDGSGINGAQVAKTNADLLALEFVKIVGIKQKILVAFHKWVATIKLNNQLSFQKNLWQIFKSPVLIDQIATDQTNVCRCLSITLAQTKLAISGDTLSAGAAKRINRVGMGRCQGRYCSPIIQKLIADSCGIEINEYSGFAPQIPIKPVEIGIIANSADDLNE